MFLAFVFTFASLAFARLGEPYRCSQTPQYKESNRDERGLPLTFVKRSVQGTFCSPKHSNDKLFTIQEQGNSIQYFRFVLNLAFWYGVLAALRFIFKKVDTLK